MGTVTTPRVISIAASISILAVAAVALFNTLDINKPPTMKTMTMTSLGKTISADAKANVFDTIITDMEQGILSAEEAMGIYNPDGEECILRPQENVGKKCRSSSGYTKFAVDAIDGKWPEGFAWTILNDEGDEDIVKGMLHTEHGEMSEETAKRKCSSFVTEICAPDKFVVYATSDKDISANSVVNVCGKKVADGEALDFTDTFFSCQAGVDIVGDEKKNLIAAMAAPSLSGAHMISGSLSGISGSMNYISTSTSSPSGADGTDESSSANSTDVSESSEGETTTDGTEESSSANSTDVSESSEGETTTNGTEESSSANSTDVSESSEEETTSSSDGGTMEPREPTDDAPTDGGVERNQIFSEGTDFKICNVNNIPRSYLLDGVTVGEGCVVLADKDLTTIPVNPQYTHANLVIVCGNKDSGTVRLNTEKLNAYDLIYEDQSLISSMVLDKASDVIFYINDNARGLSKHYAGTKGNGTPWSQANEPFTFAGQKYSSTTPPFKDVGDNVKSLEFTSTTDKITDCGSYDELKRYFKKDKKKLKAAMAEMKLRAENGESAVKRKAYEKLYKETISKKKTAKH